MKKLSAGVVLGFIGSWGVGFAAPNFNHNGIFWTKLNDTAKTGYINGYGDAMQVSVGKLESLSIAADLFHWKGADQIIRQLADQLSTGELKPAEAMHKLDTLYSNPKYSELDLGQALQLLTVKPPADAAPDSAAKPSAYK
jgi:hypothetical protein